MFFNLPVAGNKYTKMNDKRAFLIHACVETADGYAPICNKVKAESILDDLTLNEKTPTCPTCLAKLKKIK